MLTRQLCLQQMRYVSARRSAYAACTVTPSTLRRGFAATRCLPARSPASGTRTKIGTATVVNVDSVPTILHSSDTSEGLTQNTIKNLEREYRDFLQNPWKLSEAIKGRLAKDRYEEALVLVRRASKDGQCVVCWNLVIGYAFQKQRLHAGIKLFNEMKKRAQLPNAATYSTIFKGCAESQHPTTAVSEAMKIYMTMLTSTRLRPNIIHTNAVLNVCARALDIEAMMSVAETIDERERKPDTITYATLLNGLRAVVDAEAAKLPHSDKNGYTPEEHAQTVAKALEQARRIWQEVMRKWNAGALVLDEQLVCAMGRILLLGNKADAMSVLDLLEETMGIPNFEANRDDSRVGAGLPPKPSKTDGTAGATQTTTLATTQKSPTLRPVPTSRTLSLVLSALQDSRRTHLTLAYWNYLTGRKHRGRVIPDANNWNTLLYALRRGNASGKITTILESMPAAFMTEKTFRGAFKACIADALNPQVMRNATAILDRMIAVLPRPDLEALRLYHDVALQTRHKFANDKKTKTYPPSVGPEDLDAEYQELRSAYERDCDAVYGAQLDDALTNIWKKEAFPACRAHLITLLERAAGAGRGSEETHPKASSPRDRNGVHARAQRAQTPLAAAMDYAAECVALMRKLTSSWDYLLTERLVPEERAEELREKRAASNMFVSSYFRVLTASGVLPVADRRGRRARLVNADGTEGSRDGCNPRDDDMLIDGLLKLTKGFSQRLPA